MKIEFSKFKKKNFYLKSRTKEKKTLKRIQKGHRNHLNADTSAKSASTTQSELKRRKEEKGKKSYGENNLAHYLSC